jgi:hypothetical protein
MEERIGAYRIMVRRAEGKRPLGRRRRRGEDNVKMDVKELGFEDDWIDLAHVRDKWRTLANKIMKPRRP